MSRRRKIFYGIVVFLLSGAFSAPGALPAQSTAPLQKPLQHEVAVTVKLIQVYVTDKAGKPAMDLGPSDFRVFDNGQAVEITEFESPCGGGSAHGSPPRPPRRRNRLPLRRDSQMGRKFFFFFDHESNDLEGIAKARNAALHFLDTASPSQRRSRSLFLCLHGRRIGHALPS